MLDALARSREEIQSRGRSSRHPLYCVHDPLSSPPLSYDAVPGRIHPDDDMKHPQDADAAHYASVGRSALAAIGQALAAADRGFGDVEACLDMPCGPGPSARARAEGPGRAHHRL